MYQKTDNPPFSEVYILGHISDKKYPKCKIHLPPFASLTDAAAAEQAASTEASASASSMNHDEVGDTDTHSGFKWFESAKN
jgi:hypothetical protein